MATRRIPILNWQTVPDSSGDTFFEPSSVKATTGARDLLVAIFNDSGARDGLSGGFHVPKNYANTANLVIQWTSPTVAGTATWDFEYQVRAPGESINVAANDGSVTTGAQTDPGTAFFVVEDTITLTDDNFTIGDYVQWELFRDTPNDTKADVLMLVGLFFEYSD